MTKEVVSVYPTVPKGTDRGLQFYNWFTVFILFVCKTVFIRLLAVNLILCKTLQLIDCKVCKKTTLQVL